MEKRIIRNWNDINLEETTKSRYILDCRDTIDTDIVHNFYKVIGKRVFLNDYALDMNYMDIQETRQGYCIIIKNAGNYYSIVYFDKNKKHIGNRVCYTVSNARKHLTYKKGV